MITNRRLELMLLKRSETCILNDNGYIGKMMSGTTMIVCVVLISVVFGTIYDMYKKHLAFKEKTLALNKTSSDEHEALKVEIHNLKERIQVLEKIVTDEGYSIKKEINGL